MRQGCWGTIHSIYSRHTDDDRLHKRYPVARVVVCSRECGEGGGGGGGDGKIVVEVEKVVEVIKVIAVAVLLV